MVETKRLIQLPTEILIDIFKYIPSRWSLSLVCWQFYDIVCDIEREKFHLKVVDLDEEEKFESIINTKRAFSSIKFINIRNPENHVIERLEDVLFKFNLTIKRLEIASSVLSESKVIKLLNIISLVEEISFYDLELEYDESTESLLLNQLRKFNFHLCNVKVPNIILRLPVAVLQSLSIENCILKRETLHQIFELQSSISELKFDPYYVHPSSIEHLKLTKVKLMCNRNVADLLRNQEQLLSVDLSKAHIGDNEFRLICSLRSLTSLKLWVDRVSWEILDNLIQLKHLKELSLNYDRLEVEYIRSFSRIKIPSIERLKIKFPRLKITADNVAELAQNMPNVKQINISNQSIGVIEALIENFTKLESLIIGCDSDSGEVVDFPLKGIQHDKLKELCIYSSYTDQKTLKCTKSILDIVNTSLQNLEKLKLQNVITLNDEQLSEVFAKHSNLTHLFIDNSEEGFPVDDNFVNFLKRNTKRLKYFQSRGSKISIKKKFLEKIFSNEFPVIKVKPWARQIILRSCTWEHADD